MDLLLDIRLEINKKILLTNSNLAHNLKWDECKSIYKWYSLKVKNKIIEKLILSKLLIGDNLKYINLPISLISLNLSNNQIETKNLIKLRFPAFLKRLDLSNNFLKFRCLNKKIIFPKDLEELDLGNNLIDNIGIKNIDFPDGLKKLVLENNNFEECINIKFPIRLEYLNISMNHISLNLLNNLKLPKTLNKLKISNLSQYSRIKNRILFPIHLRTLDISHNNLTDNDLKNIVFHRNILNIDLFNNNIRDGNKLFSKISKNIIFFNVGHNNIQFNNNIKLPFTLKELYISDNIIGETINYIVFPNNIKSIYISNNGLYNDSVKKFNNLHRLKNLDLRNNNLENEGFMNLYLNPYLERLYISDNNIDEKYLNIKKYPFKLSYLDFFETIYDTRYCHYMEFHNNNIHKINRIINQCKKRYILYKCKMEYCRGLLYSNESNDPIIRFLKLNQARNIRRNILEYFNI